MSKFANRKPEELLAWVDENEIAQELIEYIREEQAVQIRAVASAARTGLSGQLYIGGYDAFEKLLNLFKRKQ